MAQGLLHNLVVWRGDFILVVTRSIYYTLSFIFFGLWELKTLFFNSRIFQINDKVSKCTERHMNRYISHLRCECIPTRTFNFRILRRHFKALSLLKFFLILKQNSTKHGIIGEHLFSQSGNLRPFSVVNSPASTFDFSYPKPSCLKPFKPRSSLTHSSRCSFSTGELRHCKKNWNSESALPIELLMFHSEIMPEKKITRKADKNYNQLVRVTYSSDWEETCQPCSKVGHLSACTITCP